MVAARTLAAAGAALCLAGAIAIGGPGGGDAHGNSTTDVDGASVFRSSGCAGCHVGPTTDTAMVGLAPDLSDAVAWAGERRPGLSAEEYIRESILIPGAYRAPGAWAMTMPDLGLTEAQVDALVDHLLGR